MKLTLKTLVCFLLVISTLIFLAACNDDPTTQDPQNTTDSNVTTPKVTDPEATDPEATDPAQNDSCANGHTYGDPETITAATCTQAGKQKVVCSVCHDELESDIPATGVHEPKDEWDTVIEATRYTEGKKVKKCKHCDAELAAEVIPINLDVDLTSYSVIYDSSVSAKFFGNSAKILANGIGSSATVKGDSTVPNASAAIKEILIGNTDRPESAAALALLDTDGFAITYTDGKIAIVGTNSVQTVCGVNYFIENYLDGAKALALPESKVERISEVELFSSSGFEYTFVYDADIDDVRSNPYGYDKGFDYNYVAVDDLRDALAKASGKLATSKTFPKETDEQTVTWSKEFIIGNVNRPEYAEIIGELDANEYAIAVVGNKIILAAWNERAMEVCVADFKEIISDICETVSGKKTWELPSDFFAKGVAEEKWIVDFPRPDVAENIELSRSSESNNDSLQFLYTGSGVSAAAFESYCQTLVDAGYQMHTTNTIENSIFRLYVNEAKGIVLNVAYTDYKYADEFYSEEKKEQDGKWYIEYEKAIRIISSPIDSITIPDSTITTPDPTYTKVAVSVITAVGFEHDAVGMCYIIRLEDGSFVIYDGGFSNSTFKSEDKIWDTLVKLHTDAYGEAPSESNPLRISAWIITHAHFDHFIAAENMLKKYGSRADFRMDHLIGTFPARSVLYPSSGMEQDTAQMCGNAKIDLWRSYVNNGGEGSFKFIKSFAGQKLYFANLEVEILMTCDDHPSVFFDTNDTSTITRISIANTSAAKGAATSAAASEHTNTALFLGDALTYQSRYLCAMYGSYLESEMVQLAHHGNNGCEKELYAAIRPEVVLWPECRFHLENYSNPDNYNAGYKFQVDQFVIYELDSVKYIFGSDENFATTINLGANGPDYDNFYDLWTGAKLTFDGIGATKK